MGLAERELIRRIRRQAARARTGSVRIGIGDDCAVLNLRSGEELLVTTDFSIEGVHFRREWQKPSAIGHTCLARGLSDIAAMGGRPIASFLSLACPKGTPARWINAFIRGLTSLGEQFSVELSGGDTALSPDRIVADIVVLGAVPKGKAVLRSGARPGDAIYVSGELGRAQAELDLLLAGELNFRKWVPAPQVALGVELRKIASAMIDTTDGLSVDLAHICEESDVSAVVEAAAVPIAEYATLTQAIHGGEDYQLLFTASPKKRIPKKLAGVAITRIGEIVKHRGANLIYLADGGRVKPLSQSGWQHRF